MTRLDTVPTPNRPQFLAPVPEGRRPSVEATLRDIAYVLHLTRQVKAEILADRDRSAERFPPSASLA